MDLKSTVEQRYQELDEQRHSNELKDVSQEMMLCAFQKAILEDDCFSRGVDSFEKLDHLANMFFWKFPKYETIFGGIESFVREVHSFCWELLNRYGIHTENPIQEELVLHADYGDWIKGEEKYETRVFLDHPRKQEVIGRILNLYEKREKIGERSKLSERGPSRFIMPVFDSWRAALVFAGYSHQWSYKHNKKKMLPVVVATKNALRYQRFGLKTYEAVRAVKPGEVFQVEWVFGHVAAEYVAGDMEKLKELSGYAHEKDAKANFEREKDALIKFKEKLQ